MKILLIEDEKDISDLVSYNLKEANLKTIVCSTGSEGLSRARADIPDLIILDLMLPGMGGIEVCKILKQDAKTKTIPIMMLTAKGSEVDRIVGLEVGADDYLTKPFSPRELVLRIKAILKRVKAPESETKNKPISFGIIFLDPQKFQVLVSGKEIRLTRIEFKLLEYLMRMKGRVATRDLLLDEVWGYDSALTTRTIDTHVKRLRSKLNKAGDYIETIRGIGYRFVEEL